MHHSNHTFLKLFYANCHWCTNVLLQPLILSVCMELKKLLRLEKLLLNHFHHLVHALHKTLLSSSRLIPNCYHYNLCNVLDYLCTIDNWSLLLCSSLSSNLHIYLSSHADQDLHKNNAPRIKDLHVEDYPACVNAKCHF